MAKNTIRLNESQLKKIIAESVKKILMESNDINEISSDLLSRAASKAHKDMMQNWNDSKVRTKRKGQWEKFTHGAIDRNAEEKENVCPYVPESELENMPEDTYVVLDGEGRDAVTANFRYRYSGHAGTKEQCMAFVDKYYDKNANWEYLPHIVPLEDYLEYYRYR